VFSTEFSHVAAGTLFERRRLCFEEFIEVYSVCVRGGDGASLAG
jgi:hypothetical protein